MGVFEQYPWLLIPLVIVTVEIWDTAKTMVKRSINREQRERFTR